MRNRTKVSERLGIKYPIIQGPFGGGLSSVSLASTVSNCGGLGSYGAESFSGDEIRNLVAGMRHHTSKPFAINLWVPRERSLPVTTDEFNAGLSLFAPYLRELGLEFPEPPSSFGQDYAQQIEAILECRPPVFSFVFGVPDAAILAECRKRKIVTIGTATTPEEGVALDEAGVNCIVASGFEAGGHKGAFLKPAEESLFGTFALVPQIVDQVNAPVIAAGGIADGRGIRAALALGAQGVQIGTAFLACHQSGASPQYQEKLFGLSRADTVLTKAFTGRLARSLRNRLASELQNHSDSLSSYPLQGWLTGRLKVASLAQAGTDLMPLWAGQAASLVRHRDARSLMEELVSHVFHHTTPKKTSTVRHTD